MATSKKDKADVVAKHANNRKVSQIRAGQAEYVGYVQYPRTSAIKARFEAWANETDDIVDVLDTAVSLGYKLTVSAEDDGETVKAAFYQNDRQRADAGLGISAFSDTVWDAIVRVSFFLAVYGGFNLTSDVFQQPNVKTKKDFWTE